MRTANDIIQDLGGPANVSRETGIPYTTVLGWRDSNFIPEWRRPAVLELAERKKLPIADRDFPPVEHRIPRAKPQQDAAA